MTDAASALEAVARHFRAALDQTQQFPPVLLTPDGRRVSLEIAPIAVRAGEQAAARPRLRFDKVVLRVRDRLRKALNPLTPDRTAVLLTIAAPIRLARKTTDALGVRIGDFLTGGHAELDESICGNCVRVRLVRGAPRLASKVIGFVYSPNTDPQFLLDVAQSLLEAIGEASDRPTPGGAERCLALIADHELLHRDVRRQVFKELAVDADFAEIVLVRPDGQVDSLTA